jgi:DNA-binding transcriptional MerR regulator
VAQELGIPPESDEPVGGAIASSAGESESDVGISDACRLTGLSARTVRYYEELGLLPGVRRRAAGRRVYGHDQLERLRFIQRLKTLGLSLSEIKDLNAVYAIAGSTTDMLNRLDELLGRRLNELEARIGELVSLRDDMTAYRGNVERRISQGGSVATSESAHGKEGNER